MSAIELAKMWDDMVPDEPLAWVSIVCLLIVIAKAVAVVSAVRMRPRLLESIGMTLIGVVCVVMLMQKLEGWHTSPLYVTLHVGMALYFGSRLHALWVEWRNPPKSVCNRSCQGISCSDRDCPLRQVLPIVRLPRSPRDG